MFGLVIIVVIVAIAMLFYVSYSTSESEAKKNVYKEYEQTEQGTDFVDVLLATSVCDVRVGDLITDCALGNRRKLICQGGRDSCDMLNETLEAILAQTLDAWDQSYGLYIDLSLADKNNEPWLWSRNNCTHESTGTRPVNPYPTRITGTNDYTWVELGICTT